LLLTPLQDSGRSHAPAADRQTAVLFASAGQSTPLPVQWSATSHTPADGRQTVLLGRNPSAGQFALLPVHDSTASQTPAAARQLVPDALNVQFELQHDSKEPFALPWSHASLTDPSIVPLPQSEVNAMFTKCPSVACVRLGLPG
jgi:hypothetical protein